MGWIVARLWASNPSMFLSPACIEGSTPLSTVTPIGAELIWFAKHAWSVQLDLINFCHLQTGD